MHTGGVSNLSVVETEQKVIDIFKYKNELLIN